VTNINILFQEQHYGLMRTMEIKTMKVAKITGMALKMFDEDI